MIYANQYRIYTHPTEKNHKQLIINHTGEPYQPARLYYTIHNKETILGVFEKLRCVEYEPKNQCWLWYYEAEAKIIQFENFYNKISKKHKPIVLGTFIFRSDTEMILELDSGFHILAAIQFFDKCINRQDAEVIKMRLVNRFYSSEDDEETATNREYTLDSDCVFLPPDTEIQAIFDSYEDEKERTEALDKYMEELRKKPLPEVQEIPINYYEEELSNLSMLIELHGVEALERWRGNSVTQYELLQYIEELETYALADVFDNASTEEIEELKQLHQNLQKKEELEEVSEEELDRLIWGDGSSPITHERQDYKRTRYY